MTPADRGLLTACGHADDAGLGRACRAVNAGADVSCEADGVRGSMMPLTLAASGGSVRVCQLLLQRGADVNRVLRGSGQTALHAAAACSSSGRRAVTELLLSSGAQVDPAERDQGATPLYVACEIGHRDVADLLLSAGAAINRRTASAGKTSLFVACEYGELAVAGLLLSHGADPNAAANNTCTCLIIACQASKADASVGEALPAGLRGCVPASDHTLRTLASMRRTHTLPLLDNARAGRLPGRCRAASVPPRQR